MKITKRLLSETFTGNYYQRNHGSNIITHANIQYQENVKNNKYALVVYKGNKK